jgi:uncharacterized protein YicC (UPF0701 family)
MIRSMTGFGAAEREGRAGRVQVEIRTVNHRHLNVNVRLPNLLSEFAWPRSAGSASGSAWRVSRISR